MAETPIAYRSPAEEADALLIALSMAERHKRWALVKSILNFLREAGGRLAYLGPGQYALEIPDPKQPPTPKDPSQ